jgi:hypothetical protein
MKYGEKLIQKAELEVWENPFPGHERSAFQNLPVFARDQDIPILHI